MHVSRAESRVHDQANTISDDAHAIPADTKFNIKAPS